MSDRGDQVDLVILIDPYLSSRSLPLPERVLFNVVGRPTQWLRWGVRAGRPEWSGVGRRLLDNVLVRLGIRTTIADPTHLPRTPLRKTVVTIARNTSKNYRPGYYPGDVAFIRADRRLPNQHESLETWKRATGGNFSVLPIPGGHFELVSMPLVQDLADRISQLIGE
jgi:hypothetical protein